MATSIGRQGPSLERLKALDNLPNLDDQIAELQQLCTHAARAEMVAKWLFGKLQSSTEAQQSVEAWDVFLSTLRILPPDRIATILGTSKVLKTVQTILEETEPNYTILHSLTGILDFLLELAEAATGVAVKAGLSLPATEAAQFAGVWLRSCISISITELDAIQLNAYENLSSALRVWDLRKRSSDENEAFSQHCLAACAEVLAHTGPENESVSQRKRLHDKSSVQLGVAPAIRSLLARHIFLPGRTAFFKARGSGKMRDVGSQRPSYVIESLLEPLGKVFASSSIALASLFDLALRSSPTPSPSQRNQEKPWIETLFLSLHDLNRGQAGRLVNPTALCDMLTILARRSHTVSEAILKDIMSKHAGLDQESSHGADWALVDAVIEVNGALFKDIKMAQTLFDAVTRASINLGEEAVQFDATDAPKEPMYTVWKDGIITTVLKAYARYNDLSSALDLCVQQLEKDLHGTFWSPWDHLDEPIQLLLEESLSQDQVVSICRRYCGFITQYSHDPQIEGIEQLGAAIVMLNALLGGVYREETLEQLQPGLENTFMALMELHDVHVGPGLIPALRERRCWALMTTIFEFWFPRWAAQETDPAAAVAKISTLVPRSVLDRAVGLTSLVHPEEYASVKDSNSASDAKCFVACVCTHMLAYKGTVGEESLRPYVEAINALSSAHALERAQEKLCYDAFVLFPETLGFIDANTRLSLLQRCIEDAIQRPAEDADLHVKFLKTLASTAATSGQAQVIDDIVTAAITRLEDDRAQSDKNAPHKMAIVVDILSKVPAKALTRQQREKILNCITNSSSEDQAAYAKALTSALPLVLRLMELPNPTARICLEPDVTMKMAACLDCVRDRDSEDGSSMTEYFASLVSLVLQQCIQTKDLERSVKTLVGLSSETAKIMKNVKTNSISAATASFSLVRAVFQELELNAFDSLKAQLPHRKASTVKKLVSSLAAAVSNGLQQNRETDLVSSLELLGPISPALISTSGFDLAGLLANLATYLDARLDAVQNDSPQQLTTSGPSEEAVMVRCYGTLGKFAPSAPNVRLCMYAGRLLQLPLEPQEHAAVLLTFEELLDNLGSSRIELVEELLRDGPSMPASRLLPLQLSIGKLEKLDLDTPDGSPPTAILHRLLVALSGSKNFTMSRRTLACIVDILRMKPFMVNQYNVEVTLQVLQQLMQQGGVGKNVLYLDICNTASVLLLNHRSRLQGRLHMVIKLLQVLLSQLFEPLHAWDKTTARRSVTVKHAQALSRLLKLFCEPPQLRKSQQTPSLVDESRKEQAHVGTFVQHVLHHYCAQVLHGTLGEGMKDALTPGLWAMIEAMEMNGAEGGKALSAAMNNSERAVLRGLYEEWRRFGKWRGG